MDTEKEIQEIKKEINLLKGSNAQLQFPIDIQNRKVINGVISSFIRTGEGSPEGVITATIGTLYSRSDGSANTSLYIKESGSGNTGWVSSSSGGYQTQSDILTSLSALNSTAGFLKQTNATAFIKDTNTYIVNGVAVSSNTMLRASADTERLKTADSTPTKIKEIALTVSGTIRAKFDLNTSNSTYPCYGQIYINGAAAGTSQITYTQNTNFDTYSQNFYNVAVGDLVQLYYWANPNVSVRVRNFRVYYDVIVDSTVNTD